MRKRTAETLIEVLTAIAVFSIIIAGFSDFMTEQTIALARAKDRLKIRYYAQLWISKGDYSYTQATAEDGNVKLTFDKDNHVLTVIRGLNTGSTSSLTFRLK